MIFIQKLILSGCDVRLQNRNLESPVYLAATLNSPLEIVELLIKAGADVNVPNYAGETAINTAAQNKASLELFKLLIQAGGDVNKPANVSLLLLFFHSFLLLPY